jgi:hypothetical protein
MQTKDNNISFIEKRQFFSPKIGENSDHDIGPISEF